MNTHQVCTDCPQKLGICRSPYICARFDRCFDLVTPQEELKLLICDERRHRAIQPEKDAA